MPERTRLFLPAVLMITLAVSWTEQASGAAEECITKPNAPSPRGSHWYYRTDRSTHQKCWYLGPEGAKVRAAARQAAVSQPALPKSMSQPAEEEPGTAIATTSETAAGDTRTVENKSMAPVSVHSSEAPKETVAWGPPSTATAYAEEERATPPRGDEPLVWPIVTPAEFAVSARQPDPIITTANLLIAFLAALGLVCMIVHTLRGPSIARKLGRSILGRRLGLGSYFSSSDTQPKPTATQQAAVARKLVEAKLPTSSDPRIYIEASVQRLLQELMRRQHYNQPKEFERTTRKLARSQ